MTDSTAPTFPMPDKSRHISLDCVNPYDLPGLNRRIAAARMHDPYPVRDQDRDIQVAI
jgi:hypothetical protein